MIVDAIPDPLHCSFTDPATIVGCVTGAAKSAASDAFGSIASSFAKAADSTINWLWQQMSTATAIHLGGAAFGQLFGLALAIAVVVAVAIFVVQMAVSALRRDPGGIQRAAVGLVVMGIGGGIAVAVTDLLLQAVDAVSTGVLQATTGDTVQQMGTSILAPGSISAATGNPAGLILLSLFALAAVVIVWLALTVRKLLVIVAAVLAPFAFAGSVADFSRSWVRRWVELVAALIVSKLILVFVFVTGLFVLLKGVGETSGGGAAQGITQTVTGILILSLAGLAPFAAIKLAHFAGHHMEGVHVGAGTATAGAATVQSMARPVGAMVMPQGALAAAGGALGSSAKPWTPQTATAAAEGVATEPATGANTNVAGDTPAQAAPVAGTPAQHVPSADSGSAMPPSRGDFFQQPQAARNVTPPPVPPPTTPGKDPLQ